MAAQKTRMSRRRARQKRQRRARRRARRALLTRARRSAPTECVVFRNGPGAERKLSDVIVEFGRPLLEEAPTAEAYRATMALVTAAWDLALLPAKGRAKAADEMVAAVRKAHGPVAEALGDCVGMLIDRKQHLYPDDKRFILDYELTGAGRDAHLYVCYALDPHGSP